MQMSSSAARTAQTPPPPQTDSRSRGPRRRSTFCEMRGGRVSCINGSRRPHYALGLIQSTCSRRQSVTTIPFSFVRSDTRSSSTAFFVCRHVNRRLYHLRRVVVAGRDRRLCRVQREDVRELVAPLAQLLPRVAERRLQTSACSGEAAV